MIRPTKGQCPKLKGDSTMTTNFTAIINANLDMFEEDNAITEQAFEAPTSFRFVIINEDEYIPNEDYANAWRYEFEKDGKVELGGTHFYFGSPEACANRWGGMDEFFRMARLNGWKPTGRVFFGGLYEEGWEQEEDSGKYVEVYTKVGGED